MTLPHPGRDSRSLLWGMADRPTPKRRTLATGFDLRRMGPGGRPQYEKKPSYPEAMKRPVPAPIELLFQRYPALSGFSIRGLDEIPDNCSRSGEDGELFVSDIGILPSLTTEQYGEIFQEIASTLSDLLAEQPEVTEILRGRTFARTLH
jgi:hypothetical protein